MTYLNPSSNSNPRPDQNRIHMTLTLALFLSLPTWSQALGDSGTINASASAINALDQRLRIQERLREIDGENEKATAAKLERAQVNAKGFGFISADSLFALNIRGFGQTSGLYFLGNIGTAPSPGLNNYSVRRLQSDFAFTLYKHFNWRVHLDFAGGNVALNDVNLDWKIHPRFNVRAGKFKPPTGLERLLSPWRTPFIENSFVTLLQPNRDLGVQIFGEFGKVLFEYQVGVFDGARDGQNNTGDNNDDKDVYARIFSQPFLTTESELLEGFGVGISGSYGWQEQFNSSTVTSIVSTPTGTTTLTTAPPVTNGIAAYFTGTGRQGFFSYAAQDSSIGELIRYSPQAYWYSGPFGLIGEYSATTQKVRRGTFEKNLTNSAWAVTGSWFLTGEKNAYKNIKVKNANAWPDSGYFGALEILGRFQRLKVDDSAFAPLDPADLRLTLANPVTQARIALAYALGLGWYFNSSVKLFFSYENTRFTGGAGTTATNKVAPVIGNRQTEKVVSFSLNVNY